MTPQQIAATMRPVYLRGDKIIRGATLVHLGLALSIASVYSTWAIAVPVGLMATVMFWVCAWLLPGHRFTRVVGGISLQVFCALHIFQLHGLPEMHFFFFTSFTLMILYKDWQAMWPAAVLIIGQHLLFAVLHNSGVTLYFFEESRVSVLKLIFHFGIAIADVAIASVVAAGLRDRKLHDAEQLELSERLRSELQLTRDRLVLSEKLAAVGQLAAGVGHEINNPLAFVSGNIEFLRTRLRELRPALREVPDADDLLAALDDAAEGSTRIEAIVKDLKTFARSDDSSISAVDVRDCLEFALSMAGPEIRHRATIERDYGEVPAVEANDARLGQVFLALVVNAAQAMREGRKPENRIRVQTRRDPDGQVRVSISDSGAGISAEHLSRIFDPFFTTKPVGEGTGLGLSIAHSIVTSLSGRIEVTSSEGKGSTFQVVLPSSKRVAQRARAVNTPNPPVAASAPVRVLVIDDEPDMGKLVRRLLGLSATVTIALSGKEGLERIEGETFDLILCDVMRPEMGGAEVSARFPRLIPRLVMMTGGAFTDAGARFVEQWPNAVLEKPFSAKELLALVEKVRLRVA